MKRKYFILFFLTLLAHVIEHYIVIRLNHTLTIEHKIISTIAKGGILLFGMFYYSKKISGKYWKAILFIPISVALWALIHDAGLGLLLHGDIFYLSVVTAIDRAILWFGQNGLIYTGFKLAVFAQGYYLIKYRL